MALVQASSACGPTVIWSFNQFMLLYKIYNMDILNNKGSIARNLYNGICARLRIKYPGYMPTLIILRCLLEGDYQRLHKDNDQTVCMQSPIRLFCHVAALLIRSTLEAAKY